MNNRGKKILALGIIMIFIAGVFIPSSQSLPKQLQQNSFVHDDPVSSSFENGKITCYTFGKTRSNKHDVTVSSAEATLIFERLQELKSEMTSHPYSAKTELLKTSFVNLLDEQGFFPEADTKETVRSLLNPNWVQRLYDSQKQFSSPQPLLNRGTTMLCSIGGEGFGQLFPLFLLPRPRIAMFWLGNGVTFAANLLTSRGYAAGGAQVGFTLGFMGIGLSFALPGTTIYGFIGYALIAHTTAEYVEYYPQNSAPKISNVQPMNGQENVSLSLDKLQFQINDAEGDLMSYSVTTTPYIGEGSGILKPNGVYSIPIDGLESSTEYTWRIEVSDIQETTVREFTFTTVMMAPFVSNPSPKHNALYVPIWRSNVSFNLKDYQGDLMSWTVETQPDIGSGGANNVGSGRYMVDIHGLEYNTTYTWFVNTTDGTYWTRRTYAFTTSPEGILVFEPTDDTFIDHCNPNTPKGSGIGMNVRNEYGVTSGFAWDPLIRFDVSSIQNNTTIQYAHLQLYYYDWDDNNPKGRPLRLYRATSPWDEDTVTWNTQPTYATELTSFALVPTSVGTWIEWDVTTDIRAFINGSLFNYGWKITDDTPWNYADIPIIRLYAKEFGDFIPFLIIAYDTK